MANVYFLVDTSYSMGRYEADICKCLNSFHKQHAEKFVRTTYINFSDRVLVHKDAENCCKHWQRRETNLAGAFRALEILQNTIKHNFSLTFVVLISDGDHSKVFGDEEGLMAKLKGFPAIMVALGVGENFPSNMFMKYRRLYQGVDTNLRLPPVIGIENPGETEEAFQMLEVMLFEWTELVTDANPALEPAAAINQVYVGASQIPFLGLDPESQVERLEAAVAKIESIQKAQRNTAEVNTQADAYSAMLRGIKTRIKGEGMLKLSNVEAKRLLTRNSKGYMLHNVGKFCEAAQKRNGGSWPDAVDSWVDFLRDFKPLEGEETVDDIITQSSEEHFIREAQLVVANMNSPDVPVTLEDEGLASRIEANRELVHERCSNIVDSMCMFPMPMRGVTLCGKGRDAVAIELWRASVETLPTIMQKINAKEWVNQDLCLEYRGERINGMLMNTKYASLADSTYGHWLQTYALTGNIQLCNPLSVLVGFGVIAVWALKEPLTGYGHSLLDDIFSLHEQLNERKPWEKYIRVASSEEFRKALVHKYAPMGLTCGGLGKFVLALVLAIKREKLPNAGSMLCDMRTGFLREMYAQSSKDHAGIWLAESMDMKTYLASADLVPCFESHLSIEEAVAACLKMPRWVPKGLEFPKTLYAGGEWEFNAPAVDMIFRNLATLAGTTIPALTPEDLAGVFAMPQATSEIRALCTSPIKPATLEQLEELWMRCNTPHVKAREHMSSYARLQYRRWYMSLHEAIVPVPPEYVKRAEDEGLDISHLAIGESGLFTTACGAWGCPFYGKILGPPRITPTGPRILNTLYGHISGCCVPGFHKTLRMSPADASVETVAKAVTGGVYTVPDDRIKVILACFAWVDLVPNISQIREKRGPTYTEWVKRLGLRVVKRLEVNGVY